MKTITIELQPWQQVAFGVAAVSWVAQTWGGLKVAKANDVLLDTNKMIKDAANRSGYLSMYLLVKLVESGIEIDEFDQRIISDPPLLVDQDAPTLFAEFLDYAHENGYDEDKAREFLMKLKAMREGEDES